MKARRWIPAKFVRSKLRSAGQEKQCASSLFYPFSGELDPVVVAGEFEDQGRGDREAQEAREVWSFEGLVTPDLLLGAPC